MTTPQKLSDTVNEALEAYSDKDWNYSRIHLVTQSLQTTDSPYVLWCETIDTKDEANAQLLKSLENEIKWGDRHSNELGFLELVSLRLNKALLESTSDEYWNYQRPVIRVVKRDDLVAQGVTEAFWYRITEVAGDQFDSR
jgi:hypothetical protein